MKTALFALLLAAAVLLVRPAEAAPTTSSFATLRADSTTIVIGTMVPGADLVVDIDTVVRGNATLGRRTLTTSPDGQSRATGRVILFLDSNNAFRWVGTLHAGPSLERGVVYLRGFYDWNAHLVSPGLMTYPELLDALAGKPLLQTLAVTIKVADTMGGYVAWGSPLAVTYDPVARTTTMSGLAASCLGHAEARGFEWGRIELWLTSTCATLERRLELRGVATGVDASGAMTADVFPDAPYLDVKDIATFMNDASIVSIARLVDVRLSDGTTWVWNLAAQEGSFGFTSFDFAGASIAFRPPLRTATSPYVHAPQLMDMIDRTAYTSCVFTKAGKPDRECTFGRGRSKPVRK